MNQLSPSVYDFLHFDAVALLQQVFLVTANNKAWKAMERERNETLSVVAAISACAAGNRGLQKSKDLSIKVSCALGLARYHLGGAFQCGLLPCNDPTLTSRQFRSTWSTNWCRCMDIHCVHDCKKVSGFLLSDDKNISRWTFSFAILFLARRGSTRARRFPVQEGARVLHVVV